MTPPTPVRSGRTVRRRPSLRRRIWRLLDWGAMIVLAGFFLFPIVFMIVSSFKPEKAIFDDLQRTVWAFIPHDLTLDNYRRVFERVPFGGYLLTSALVTATTVAGGLLVNSMVAFALARMQWRGRGPILSLIVALIIVPIEAIAVPLLVIVNSLPWFDGSTSWLDSHHVQIIPFIAEAFSIYLFYQFFIGLPRELDEAALIDGASPFGIYWRIVVPLSRPVFATVAILQALTMWNSYLWPLMVTRSQEVRPLTIGITAFYVLDIRWGQILAFASMITIPVLLAFLLFQRWFIRSVASAGLKG